MHLTVELIFASENEDRDIGFSQNKAINTTRTNGPWYNQYIYRESYLYRDGQSCCTNGLDEDAFNLSWGSTLRHVGDIVVWFEARLVAHELYQNVFPGVRPPQGVGSYFTSPSNHLQQHAETVPYRIVDAQSSENAADHTCDWLQPNLPTLPLVLIAADSISIFTTLTS